MKVDFPMISAFLAPVFAICVTWVIARRKNKADTSKVEAETDLLHIKNVEAIVMFWQKMAGDLTSEVHQLKEQVMKSTQQNRELTSQIFSMRQENLAEKENFAREINKLKQMLPKN